MSKKKQERNENGLTAGQQVWYDKLNGVVQNVMDTTNIAPVVAKVALGNDSPWSNYSPTNQFLVAMQLMFLEEDDARGVKSWNSVGRKPIKGFKRNVGISIPMFGYYTKDEEQPDGTTKRVKGKYIKGFGSTWILSDKQTEPWPGHEDTWVNPQSQWQEFAGTLPLLDVAEAINVSVKGATKVGGANGSFSPATQDIHVMVQSGSTFFHELAHAVDNLLTPGGLQGGQVPEQEIVAQLAAEVLVELVGYDEQSLGYTQRYIEHYADKAGIPTVEAVAMAVGRVTAIVGFIADVAQQLESE